MHSTCPAAESLARMLDDLLVGQEAEDIESHVATCPDCQRTLERLTRVSSGATDTPWVRRPGGDGPVTESLRDDLTTGLIRPDDGEKTRDGRDGRGPARDEAGLPDLPGYRVERELGRGGMGVVYLARQAHANRMVALKMVLADRGRPEDLLRFLMEGESLARLQHPNIVQVYEVSECLGQPFFSMEYVEGKTLAQGLGESPRTPGESAALVETIARAVHAAHQSGIVHRDLKPANILLSDKADARQGAVDSWDGRPAVPKITDFGLAKHVGSDSGLTHTGQILGTPSYMAPEQATGGASVGVQADIYALGAILYETLSGRPPFKGNSAWDTMMQVVHEPVVPPSRWRDALPRDLEVICLKCLEKGPSDRYPSADALAEDLRRFRAGEPILARPAGPARLAWLWCRRNPLPAALASMLLASTLAGAVAVGWGLHRAGRERAEKSLIADYLTDHVLAESSTEVNPRGANFTVRELLDRVGARIGGDFQGHPRVEAPVRETVGKSYLSLGEYAKAEPHLRAAIRLDRELHGPGHPATLRVANVLAVLLEQDGRAGEAEALLRENLAKARHSLGPEDPITLEAADRLGSLLRAIGRPGEAEPLTRQALDGRRRALPADHADTLRSVRNLCLLDVDLGRLEAAETLADEYERGIRCARGPKHPDNVTALGNLGLIRRLRGKPAEANGSTDGPRTRPAGSSAPITRSPEMPSPSTPMSSAPWPMPLDERRYRGRRSPCRREGQAGARSSWGHPAKRTISVVVGLAPSENARAPPGLDLPIRPQARHHVPGGHPVLGGIGTPRRREMRRGRGRTLHCHLLGGLKPSPSGEGFSIFDDLRSLCVRGSPFRLESPRTTQSERKRRN